MKCLRDRWCIAASGPQTATSSKKRKILNSSSSAGANHVGNRWGIAQPAQQRQQPQQPQQPQPETEASLVLQTNSSLLQILPSRAWMKMQRGTQLDWQMSLKSVMLPDMAIKIIVPGAGAKGSALYFD